MSSKSFSPSEQKRAFGKNPIRDEERYGVHRRLKFKGNPRNPQKITRTEKGYEYYNIIYIYIYTVYCLPGSILSAFLNAIEKLHCRATICKWAKMTFDLGRRNEKKGVGEQGQVGDCVKGGRESCGAQPWRKQRGRKKMSRRRDWVAYGRRFQGLPIWRWPVKRHFQLFSLSLFLFCNINTRRFVSAPFFLPNRYQFLKNYYYYFKKLLKYHS